MLRLKDIQVFKKPVCASCGRPLVGDFCEIHGTDIRIDPIFVDASFQVTDLAGDPLCEYCLDVSLPHNQFLRLFRSRMRKNLSEMGNDLIYEVKITPSISSKEIVLEFILDFLGELDAEAYFFGYIPFRSFQIRRSGITLHIVFKFEITSSDTIRFCFTVLTLRRLSDYISWRLKHCRGDIQSIQESLLTTRSNVFLSNGEARKIIEIQWDSSKVLPSKIVLQNSENKNSTTSELPTKLYQGRDHFFLGQRTENEMISGLKDLAYQFVNNFLRYLRFQGFDGHFRKIKDKMKYKKLLGQAISLNRQFLKTVGEKQNKYLIEKGLLRTLIPSQSRQPRALLIVSCSATKTPQIETIPAFLRYIGRTYLFLKFFLLKDLWPSQVDLYIVSAKYGILKPEELIPFYEQKLKPETVSKTKTLIEEQLETLRLDNYVTCFINLSRIYLQAITSLETALENHGCQITKIQKNQTKRNIVMINWLWKNYSSEL